MDRNSHVPVMRAGLMDHWQTTIWIYQHGHSVSPLPDRLYTVTVTVTVTYKLTCWSNFNGGESS